MALHEPPQLTIHLAAAEVAKLDLRPGDRLVLRCERELEPDEWQRLSDQCRNLFPDHEVIFLPPELHLGVVREGEPPVKFREFF